MFAKETLSFDAMDGYVVTRLHYGKPFFEVSNWVNDSEPSHALPGGDSTPENMFPGILVGFHDGDMFYPVFAVEHPSTTRESLEDLRLYWWPAINADVETMKRGVGQGRGVDLKALYGKFVGDNISVQTKGCTFYAEIHEYEYKGVWLHMKYMEPDGTIVALPIAAVLYDDDKRIVRLIVYGEKVRDYKFNGVVRGLEEKD